MHEKERKSLALILRGTLSHVIPPSLWLEGLFFNAELWSDVTSTKQKSVWFAANRENIYTQTEPSRFPANLPVTDSIWTVNEDEAETTNHYDVPQQISEDLKAKTKRSYSAPVLNGIPREMGSAPLLIAAIMPRVESFQSSVQSVTDRAVPQAENPQAVEPQMSISSSVRSAGEPADETITAPLRMESLPLLPIKQSSTCSTQPSTTSLCKTVDGVPLTAEKVVIFSYDSFVAGGISAHSSVGANLPQLTGLPTDRKPSIDKKPDYNRMSLLPSTDLWSSWRRNNWNRGNLLEKGGEFVSLSLWVERWTLFSLCRAQ